jgi:hypothetical protein
MDQVSLRGDMGFDQNAESLSNWLINGSGGPIRYLAKPLTYHRASEN